MTFRRPSAAFLRALPLAAILLLGFALRAYDVTRTPPELIVDELDLYNSAQSIVTTGRDVDGTLLPFLSSAFTRNPPMYAIAEYPASLVLGNGPLGLRMPAVLFGTLAILLVFAIAFELTRRRDVALVAALVAAVAPVFIQFSRIAWEPASELPFLLGGIYFLVRAFARVQCRGGDRARIAFRDLAFAAILLALTCYTYMAGWFYAAALSIPILLSNARELRSANVRARVAAAFVLGAAIASPALWMWFANPETYARTERIATFGSGVSIAALAQFARNYVAHFRWSYLVTTGDPVNGSTWRYLNGFGAFYWWTIVLAALGLFVARRYLRVPWAFPWLLVWLAAYPMGGALTNEGVPNAPRTLAGMPVFCLLAAFGAIALLDGMRRIADARGRRFATRALVAAFALNVAASVAVFAQFYFTRFDYISPNMWDSGTRDLFAVIRSHAAGKRRLCFSVRRAWYGAETYFRYYLPDTRLVEIENVDDPRCFLPGTLLATDDPPARRGFRIVASVPELGGDRFGVVSER